MKHPTNKQARKKILYRKWKERCKLYDRPEGHHILKHQAKPCSCDLCSGDKYSRKIKHKNKEYDYCSGF